MASSAPGGPSPNWVDRLKQMIDEVARNLAITRFGLDENLHVPIAAADEAAITASLATYRGFSAVDQHEKRSL